jgi:hypothetical protein
MYLFTEPLEGRFATNNSITYGRTAVKTVLREIRPVLAQVLMQFVYKPFAVSYRFIH